MKSCEGFPNVYGSLTKKIAVKRPIAPGRIQESICIDLEKKIM